MYIVPNFWKRKKVKTRERVPGSKKKEKMKEKRKKAEKLREKKSYRN